MMRPSAISTETVEAPPAPPCDDNESRHSASGKPNKCSCGNTVVKIDEEGRLLSPNHHTVFNRLYRYRLTKELKHRKLAAEQIEKEARECTYIPLTNNVREELKSTASLSSIAHREQRVEEAREQFLQGKICVECLKNVEISTGAIALEDELFAEEPRMQSVPNTPLKQGGSSDSPPEHIMFHKKASPKVEKRTEEQTNGRPLTPTRPRLPLPKLALEESRNDEIAVAKKSPSVETDRESYSSFAEHPPSVIVITPTRKDSKGKLNRFGFPSPSPTKKDKHTPLTESRNDEVPAVQKTTFPPRPPTPTKSAFSFDNVSPIPSAGTQEREKPVEVPKVETLDSPATHKTPILKNVQAEDRDPPVLSLSVSNGSTVSSADIPLRLDSYMSIDATPPPTPSSIPYDEKTPRYESIDDIEEDIDNEVDQKDKKEEECEVAVIATAKAEKGHEPVEEEDHNSPAEPSTSPMSHVSEKSMRSTSILDREESFNGPIFVKVAPTDEEGRQNTEGEKVDNWIGQVTECVNCDDTGAASTTENASTTGSIVNEDDSVLERKAADKAYASCEIEGGEMTCVDLVDEPTPQMASEANIGELSEAKPYAQLVKEAKDEPVIQHKEVWLETATEWARYEKSASPTTAEAGQVTTEVTTDAAKIKNDESQGVNAKDVQNLNLAPSDEGFFDSSNRKNTGKSTGGSSQNSADKSTVCSTVALTEASNNEHEFKGDFQRNTSKGEFDEFLDRLTDCVSCWKLEPWPEQDLERE